MGGPASTLPLTPAEYLAFERASETRHEYADGQVFAMSGGTREHALIAANLLGELRAALRERPCEVLGSDLRVKVERSSRYFYPDVSVLCGPPAFEDETRDVVLNPRLVAEVLSESSERYDRGDKFAHYRTIASLQDYLLVSQTEVRIEHFRRQGDGSWLYRALGPGDRLVLSSLDCAVAVDDVYLKVFPATG